MRTVEYIDKDDYEFEQSVNFANNLSYAAFGYYTETKPEKTLIEKIINDIIDRDVIAEIEKGNVALWHNDKFNIFGMKLKNFYTNKKLKDVFFMVAPPHRNGADWNFTLYGYGEADGKGYLEERVFYKIEKGNKVPEPIFDAFVRLYEKMSEKKYLILDKYTECGNSFGIDAAELN